VRSIRRGLHRHFAALLGGITVIGAIGAVPFFLGLNEVKPGDHPFHNGWVIFGSGIIVATALFVVLLLAVQITWHPTLRVMVLSATFANLAYLTPLKSEGSYVTIQVLLSNDADRAVTYHASLGVRVEGKAPFYVPLELTNLFIDAPPNVNPGFLLPTMTTLEAGRERQGTFVFVVPQNLAKEYGVPMDEVSTRAYLVFRSLTEPGKTAEIGLGLK
jgi:hypothetical protein